MEAQDQNVRVDQQSGEAAGKAHVPEWHRPVITVVPLAQTPHGGTSEIDLLHGATPS